MVLLLRQLFPAQAALVQAAGLGTGQIGRQHRVDIEVGKSLLRQQNAAAGALLHPQQDLTVAAQLGFVQQIAGGGQAVQDVYKRQVKHSIRVNKQLYSKQSDYQRIDIFETPEFGRVLTLDGNVMLTERDEFIYDEMILSLIHI